MTTFPVAAILGHLRIGRNRELKKAFEAHWAGRTSTEELLKTEAELRQANFARLVELGLRAQDVSPPENSPLYDQVLDVISLLRAVPVCFEDRRGLELHSTLARGDQGSAPEEMAKWSDTNYHYLVPEIGPNTPTSYADDRYVERFLEAKNWDYLTRPAIVGPATYLALAKIDEQAPEGYGPLERLSEVQVVCATLLSRLGEAGAAWVQFDEPAFVSDNLSCTRLELAELAKSAYTELAGTSSHPRILVTTPYGNELSALPALAGYGVETIHLALGLDALSEPGMFNLGGVDLVVGAIDARSIRRADLAQTAALLGKAKPLRARSLRVATTNSFQHVPHGTAFETWDDPELDANLHAWLVFADQKAGEVVTLAKGINEGSDTIALQIEESTRILRERAIVPGVIRLEICERVGALGESEHARASYGERAATQDVRLVLSALPTTTIGLLSQITDIRRTRAVYAKGTLSDADYRTRIEREITEVVVLQEKLGLDVPVHGEAERNDMVQHFAELLGGFATTCNGWVQSYGSRCTRPSILWGDVARPRVMIVDWVAFARSLIDKPVKGMPIGPVTIIAWSSPRNDLGLVEVTDQVGLALRDEVEDLEAAEVVTIQVDEPIPRELLPFDTENHADYLRRSVDSFRVVTAGVRPNTQIHTHLCYSEFGQIIDAIAALDADVASIEAAHSHMEVLPEFVETGFDYGIGPGVWDTHSPRIPSVEGTRSFISVALGAIPAKRPWINPDCSLKTRGYEGTLVSLSRLVEATKEARETL